MVNERVEQMKRQQFISLDSQFINNALGEESPKIGLKTKKKLKFKTLMLRFQSKKDPTEFVTSYPIPA